MEYGIIVIIVLFVIFLIGRELFCWYYKINERIELQKETNLLQKKTNHLLENLLNRSNSSFDNFSSSNIKTSSYNNSTKERDIHKSDSFQSITKSEISKDDEYIKGIIGVPIELEGFEVAQFDFEIKMNWVDARNACNKIGDGWKLPSKVELEIIYENRQYLPTYSFGTYWSSTKNEANLPWVHDFNSGIQSPKNELNECFVRAIRAT